MKEELLYLLRQIVQRAIIGFVAQVPYEDRPTYSKVMQEFSQFLYDETRS